jgi:hypothetical protein
MGTQEVTQKAPRTIVTRPCEGICADFGDGPGQVVTYRVMEAIGWPTVEVSLCQDCADGYDEMVAADGAS